MRFVLLLLSVKPTTLRGGGQARRTRQGGRNTLNGIIGFSSKFVNTEIMHLGKRISCLAEHSPPPEIVEKGPA